MNIRDPQASASRRELPRVACPSVPFVARGDVRPLITKGDCLLRNSSTNFDNVTIRGRCVTTPAARLATGPGGLTPGRAGFAPAGRRTKFHEVIAYFIPPRPAFPGRTGNSNAKVQNVFRNSTAISKDILDVCSLDV